MMGDASISRGILFSSEPLLFGGRGCPDAPDARDSFSQNSKIGRQQVHFESVLQLCTALETHRYCHLDIVVDDLMDMMAQLRSTDRLGLIHTAVIAWFHHALGFPVIEAECREQERTDDSSGILLLFRLRLKGSHTEEVAKLGEGEELGVKFSEQLIKALPGDLMAKSADTLSHLVQISWTKPGSIELGGVAALNLVLLVVIALGYGTCYCSFCCPFTSCPNRCPCLSRDRPEVHFAQALAQLQDRGAQFEVNPDGSAIVHVPPAKISKWRCPDCTTM